MGPSRSILYRPPPDWASQRIYGGRFRDLRRAVAAPLPSPVQNLDTSVSWQVGTTVAALSERVETLLVDEATQDALEARRNRAD